MRAVLAMPFVCLLAAALPAHADQLVAVARPLPSPDLASLDGPVTLSYELVEIFTGEHEQPTAVVRHDAVSRDDRSRLATRESVILVADPDRVAPGRYVAPVPVRATDDAVAAFRAWKTPETAAPAAAPIEPDILEVEVIEARRPELPAARVAAEPARAPAAPPARAPVLAESPRAQAPSARSASAMLPRPAATPLGPPLDERTDLRPGRPRPAPLPLPPKD